MAEVPKHHPTLYTTGRTGCWATCVCGWKSITFTKTIGAHLAFGDHLRNLKSAIEGTARDE